MKDLIDVAMGRKKADIVLKNGKIVDVFSGEIISGDLAIYDKYIAGIGEYSGINEIDVSGKYIMPGFIDTHVHIESSMVSPVEYAKAVMPKGVTTVIADPHEIANVCGEKGIDYMRECAKKVPLSIHFMVPSCVPATPFETSGAVLDSNVVNKLLPNSLGLGEMMNYVGVINGDDEVLAKIKNADVIDGHAPFLTGNNLNAYLCAMIKTDHECTDIAEMKEKLSKGMYIQIREGTLSKNLHQLVSGINSKNLRRFTFCTDDKFVEDIIKHGTIGYSINECIKLGISPIDAITIATLNAAECYGLKGIGAIAPGYFADLVITEGLDASKILQVYKNGVLAAENDKALFNAENLKLDGVMNTVHIDKVTAENFAFDVPDESFPVIYVNPKVITTTKVMRNKEDKLSKVCVIERHHGTNTKGIGFADNFGITNGAIASTIGHDSHNIIVIGDNDSDMALAVNTLGKNGGICVCSKGQVLKYFALPIAGLMSDKDNETVIKDHRDLYIAAKSLNINPEIDPFMSLSFLPLPVIPEIRITNKGLFDVTKFEFI